MVDTSVVDPVLPKVLGVLAGVIQVVGYCLYYIPLYKGKTKPNIAIWAVWSFGTLIGFLSFRGMTHDWAKSFLPMLCNLSCICIFLYALINKRFDPITALEKKVGIIYIVAALVATQTATYGNLVQQVGTLTSFIPYIISVRKKPELERPLPWLVWSLAYATLLTVCLLKFEHWQELVYPINCMILHGTIGILALKKKTAA